VSAPPAVLYRYTPDRKGEHYRAQLASFTGWLHADGYAGFGKLYEVARASSSSLPLAGPPRVAEVAYWRMCAAASSTRRKGADRRLRKKRSPRSAHCSTSSGTSRAAPPEQRRNVLQRLVKPRLDELATWLDAQLQRIPGKSDLAGAIRYARSRWPTLKAYLTTPFLLQWTVCVSRRPSRGGKAKRRGACCGPIFLARSRHIASFFTENLMLRRHDYSVNIAGGFAAAQLTSAHVEANGIRLPTKRRAYARGSDR
jgi:hypothetical protein